MCGRFRSRRKHSRPSRPAVCVIPELLCVMGLGAVQAPTGTGGIQGLPASASRMTVKPEPFVILARIKWD